MLYHSIYHSVTHLHSVIYHFVPRCDSWLTLAQVLADWLTECMDQFSVLAIKMQELEDA